MLTDTGLATWRGVLDDIRSQGLWKDERVLLSPQAARVRVARGEVLNFCANNYLGLANDPGLIAAARDALERYGFGLSSVRFICGTQDLHKHLEGTISRFFGTEDSILYSSCFDANGGLFETLLGEEDAIVSDELNHASIIDGIRLCRAQRFRYRNNDMDDLEAQLQAASSARIRMIATDGVFSMDGTLARLDRICDLADRYGAMVMVDDSHASGFVGPTGRGTPEVHGVARRVDVMTSTLGKALGGASGGFTTGRRELIDLLRQRSRPYLFSNTLAPAIAAAAIAAFERLEASTELRDRLERNTRRFRQGMTTAGFDLVPGVHPICPVMLYDARLARDMADDLLQEGVYVVGFSFPVVPRGKARIRVQVSAGHSDEQIDTALDAFAEVGRRRGVLPAAGREA